MRFEKKCDIACGAFVRLCHLSFRNFPPEGVVVGRSGGDRVRKGKSAIRGGGGSKTKSKKFPHNFDDSLSAKFYQCQKCLK